MDYKGKRLLILGGAAQCVKVVKAAKEMGVYTIVTDMLDSSPAMLMADEKLLFSVMDAQGILDWCRENPVDGVLNFAVDYAQKTHQKVCEALGFPSFGTAEQYRILTDKKAFKKLCIENGVDVIPEYDEEKPEEIEYPVLVKPAESSGSRGSCTCKSAAGLAEALKFAKEESRDGKAIVERNMYGLPDFAISYIVIDGEPYLTRTIDRILGRPEDNLHRQCICGRSPSRFTDLYIEKAHNKVCNMIKTLGIKNGPVFMQGFVDGDKFRFYDPGLRFNGSEFEQLANAAAGVDIVKAFISYSLGGSLNELAGKLKDLYKLNGKCGIHFFIDANPGTIGSIDGIEEVSAMPEVVVNMQKHYPGYDIPASGDVKQRIFEVVTLSENNRQAVAQIIEKIDSALKIKDADGKVMNTPIASIDSLFPCANN